MFKIPAAWRTGFIVLQNAGQTGADSIPILVMTFVVVFVPACGSYPELGVLWAQWEGWDDR